MNYILAFLLSLPSFASLSSNIPSTVDGVTIPNVHRISKSGGIYRGMEPREKIQEIIDLGITDILTFKKQTKTEVDEQRSAFIAKGYDPKRLHHIEFPWKDIEKNPRKACLQTMKALRLIRQIKKDKNRSLYFHCTVGEDRTGYLAGIYRMAFRAWSTDGAFYKEMCKRGYSDGNPVKPEKVVNEIEEGLSKLFFTMAYRIGKGEIFYYNLSDSVCNFDKLDDEFMTCK